MRGFYKSIYFHFSIFIILILLNVGFFGYLYLTVNYPNSIPFYNPPIIASDQSINLPIPLDSSEIHQAAIGYTFHGKIVTLINTPLNTNLPEPQRPLKRLITDISPSNDLPEFYVTSNTAVVKIDPSMNRTVSNATFLKPGQSVRLHVWYELSSLYRWILREIEVYE